MKTNKTYVRPAVPSAHELQSRVSARRTVAGEYLNALGLYRAGKIFDANEYTEWVCSEVFNLDGLPDLVLLRGSLMQILSDKGKNLYIDDLYALYANRQLVGKLRAAIIAQSTAGRWSVPASMSDDAIAALWPEVAAQTDLLNPTTRSGALRALVVHPETVPIVRAAYRWSPLHCAVPISTPDSIIGAFALALVDFGDYTQAEEVLSTAPTYPVVSLDLAHLALHYTTERWSDVIDYATVITSRTLDDYIPHSPDMVGQADSESVTNGVIATAMLAGAYAHMKLGAFGDAHEWAEAAVEFVGSHADEATITEFHEAFAHYIHGMSYRLEGRESDAGKELSAAMALSPCSRYETAIRNTEYKEKVTSPEEIHRRTDPYDPESVKDEQADQRNQERDLRESYMRRANLLLDRQIGMAEVKNQVRRLIVTTLVEQERVRRGGVGTSSNLNLIFTGPPGTGKSTIVEVLALMFAAIGVVDSPVPIIMGRSDLVADTPGGTAKKTKDALHNCIGHVGFIDEMYALVQATEGANADAVGKEALDTLVAEAEHLIGKTVLVVAGYEADMDRVLAVNEGLSSRFPRRVDFRSYHLDEIAEICQVQAKARGRELSRDAMQWIADDAGYTRVLLTNANGGRKLLDELGNGRFSRNLVESAIEHQALRLSNTYVMDGLSHEGDTRRDLASASERELLTLEQVDIENACREIVNTKLKNRAK